MITSCVKRGEMTGKGGGDGHDFYTLVYSLAKPIYDMIGYLPYSTGYLSSACAELHYPPYYAACSLRHADTAVPHLPSYISPFTFCLITACTDDICLWISVTVPFR